MNSPVEKSKNRRGVVLVAFYMVMTVLSIFAAQFVSRAIYQNNSVITFNKKAQAFNLAESGLDKAIAWFRTQDAPPVGNKNNPWGGGAQNLILGTYSVAITDLGNPAGSTTIRRYRVASTGTVGNINKVLTNYVQTDNYARYIWFTNRETYNNNNVWFVSQDTLNGPSHTNGHFNIYGNPTFTGEVHSVDDYIRFYNNGNNINLGQATNPPYDIPNFQNGINFGADYFAMPSQALNLRTASTNGGLRLLGDTNVVLNSNGTMDVTNDKNGWNNHNMPLPANGALFVACDGSKCRSGASLTVSGTLNGRLTVGAQYDVLIPNSVVYKSDPRTNPASTDTLGIISERDIIISDNAPNNLEIDGSIMALETSFMMNNWWVGPPKGTLTVYGGIIQDQRGPVGTFNSVTGQKASGYSKSYSYDPRLLSNPPPFFPTTGDYITLSWED